MENIERFFLEMSELLNRFEVETFRAETFCGETFCKFSVLGWYFVP